MNKRIVHLAVILLAAVLLLGAGCVSQKTTKTTATPTPTATVAEATFDAAASDAKILADANGQWAATAKASTQYGEDSWAAKQATGQPNVEAYGDNVKAWAPMEKNKGTETLEVTFSNPVYALGIRVRESYGSGAVTKIELKDTDGVYHKVFEGADATRGLGYLQTKIEKTTYKVNGAKITLDTTKAPNEWTEIDAVQLVGTK